MFQAQTYMRSTTQRMRKTQRYASSLHGQDFVMWSVADIPSFLAASVDVEGRTQVTSRTRSYRSRRQRSTLPRTFSGSRSTVSLPVSERRARLGEFLDESHELHIAFPDLDLDVAEDNLYCRELTLDDLLQLHHGLGLPTSLHIQVSSDLASSPSTTSSPNTLRDSSATSCNTAAMTRKRPPTLAVPRATFQRVRVAMSRELMLTRTACSALTRLFQGDKRARTASGCICKLSQRTRRASEARAAAIGVIQQQWPSGRHRTAVHKQLCPRRRPSNSQKS